ncbi:unnamed protein product [Adineta steineri]|uniref:Fas-associated factor 1/2-like UAS domain-containing protein n=1 Tax=Adineta steineri TaxID=433720 RepID=A0A815BK41_9BILA|nr:unnamed protein product [Adineta steineri]CAF1403255.1 unnamed protein product [Adineta steineri]
MDNDFEFSDDETSDNYNIFASNTSFEAFNECHDDTNVADTFHACFAHRYDSSPSFFPGSLSDACKAAFNSQEIHERRPLLIYIHHDKISDACESEVDRTEFFYESLQQRYERCPTLFNGFLPNVYEPMFSLTIAKEYCPVLIYLHHDNSEFNGTICPITIIDCLLENFIIYSWDNTSELNQEIMEITWKEMFSSPFNLTFPFNQYPMIIGIMKLFEENKGDLVTPQYEFIPLLNGDILTRTQAKISREGFLKELVLFQQEYVANEQALACDFITKTGLCWDVILEISQYLSLNDAINSYSSCTL